jgi:hypothetical protein
MVGIFLLWALRLHALEPGPRPNLALHDVGPAEAAVYAAFLDQNYKPAKQDGPLARGVIILENESQDLWQKNRRAWETFLAKRVTGPGRASEECLSAFLQRPQQTLRYFNFPPTKHTLRLVRSDELRHRLDKGWNGFYEAYAGAQGVISFGAIGFGSAGNEALFTVRSQCGNKCGYRDLVYMQRINSQWLLVLKEPLP